MQNKGTSAFLPDWALMDLFKAPVNKNPVNTSVAFNANPNISNNAVAGRININSLIQPFEPTVGLQRWSPLEAALTNTPLSSASSVSTLASNIYYHQLAANGQSYVSTAPSAYTLPGEIAEIKGVADGGEASEANLQSVVDLLTTRSNVFRVYSVGQAIQQTKNSLQVTGEHRDYSIIERSVGSSGAVIFHVVYHRNITF
jgi:hypothetical protein